MVALAEETKLEGKGAAVHLEGMMSKGKGQSGMSSNGHSASSPGFKAKGRPRVGPSHLRNCGGMQRAEGEAAGTCSVLQLGSAPPYSGRPSPNTHQRSV